MGQKADPGEDATLSKPGREQLQNRQRTRAPKGEIFPFRVLGERKIEAGKGGSGPRDATSSRREKPLSTALRGVAPEGGDLAGAGAD